MNVGPGKLYIDGKHVGDIHSADIDGMTVEFTYAAKPIATEAERDEFFRALRERDLRRRLDVNFGATP